MSDRQSVPTAAPWAAVVGYSRAVRVGHQVYVSGTAAVGDDGGITHPGDAYRQARRCLEIILDALHRFGGAAEHVVRTRVYLTAATDWEAVGRAHGEVFGDIRPATSFVVVAALIHRDMRVEIEADAVLPSTHVSTPNTERE